MDYNRIQGVIAREKARFIAQIRASNATLANTLETIALPWWHINNTADEDTTDVAIYEAIGGWWGMLASEFIAEINKITTNNIRVRINSPGGSVFDSIAIYNALVAHPANIIAHVDSLAASGASIIAMSGDKRVMGIGSQMMIHDAAGLEIGNAAIMREMADFLDKQSDNIATIYQAHAGGTAEEWRALMLAETWFMAQEAVDAGLADEVYVKPEKEPEKPAEKEEEGSEEEDDGEEETTPEEAIEDLLKKTHSLAAFNYNHMGRKNAPAPVLNSADDYDVDAICAALAKVL